MRQSVDKGKYLQYILYEIAFIIKRPKTPYLIHNMKPISHQVRLARASAGSPIKKSGVGNQAMPPNLYPRP